MFLQGIQQLPRDIETRPRFNLAKAGWAGDVDLREVVPNNI